MLYIQELLFVHFGLCSRTKLRLTLREKCLYSEFFWSVFSRIWTEYGEMQSISPYSVQMWKNTDQKNSEFGHFAPSVRDAAFEMQLSFHVNELEVPLSSALKLLLSNCLCKKK